MRPSEAQALEQAVGESGSGEGLTPWLEDPIETLAADATQRIDCMSVNWDILHDTVRVRPLPP